VSRFVHMPSPYVEFNYTMTRPQVAVMYTVCDLLACFVFVLAGCLLANGDESDITHFSKHVVTVDHYSVRARSSCTALQQARVLSCSPPLVDVACVTSTS